jgi:hypothetical protein
MWGILCNMIRSPPSTSLFVYNQCKTTELFCVLFSVPPSYLEDPEFESEAGMVANLTEAFRGFCNTRTSCKFWDNTIQWTSHSARKFSAIYSQRSNHSIQIIYSVRKRP